MESLRDFFVTLGLDADGASFASAQVAVDLLEKGLELLVDGAKKLADVFVQSVMHTAAFGEEMEVLAQKTGIGIDSLQKLGYAASLSNSSAQAMGVGLGHLAKQIEAAKSGSDQAQKNFTDLGLTMDDVRNKTPEQIFLKMADRMKALGAGSKRQDLAMKLLGRSGKDLIPTLDRGADGLRAMGIEADELNIIMSEDGIHAAAAFKENLEKLEKVGDGLRQMIAGPLMEAIQPFLDELVQWLRANKDLIKQKIEKYIGLIVSGFKIAVKVIRLVVDSINKIIAVLKILTFVAMGYVVAQQLMNVGLMGTLVNFALNTAAAALYGATLVWAGLKAAFAWLAAVAPIVLIGAALAFAALAAEDLYVFLTGGRSVLGMLGPKWTKFIDDFTKPSTKDHWITFTIKGWLNTLVNLEKVWDSFSKSFVKAYDFLAYGSSSNKATRKGGAWESTEQGEVDKKRAWIRGMDAASRENTRGVMASGGSGGTEGWGTKDYGGVWRAQGTPGSRTSITAPLTIVVPPGTPTPLVKEALKEVVREEWNGVMSDANAATAN